jgi:hypothetical protein
MWVVSGVVVIAVLIRLNPRFQLVVWVERMIDMERKVALVMVVKGRKKQEVRVLGGGTCSGEKQQHEDGTILELSELTSLHQKM